MLFEGGYIEHKVAQQSNFLRKRINDSKSQTRSRGRLGEKLSSSELQLTICRNDLDSQASEFAKPSNTNTSLSFEEES